MLPEGPPELAAEMAEARGTLSLPGENQLNRSRARLRSPGAGMFGPGFHGGNGDAVDKRANATPGQTGKRVRQVLRPRRWVTNVTTPKTMWTTPDSTKGGFGGRRTWCIPGSSTLIPRITPVPDARVKSCGYECNGGTRPSQCLAPRPLYLVWPQRHRCFGGAPRSPSAWQKPEYPPPDGDAPISIARAIAHW